MWIGLRRTDAKYTNNSEFGIEGGEFQERNTMAGEIISHFEEQQIFQSSWMTVYTNGRREIRLKS